MSKNIDLGSFSVDVELQKNGKFDVWISHEGSSGEHYRDVTADKIGELVAGDIECIAEGYQNEFGRDGEDDETIRIIYDGLNEDGTVFTNGVYAVDSVDKLEEAISMLRSKGYLDISVEYNDETFWLSEYTISEIEDFIREDMQAEMENL